MQIKGAGAGGGVLHQNSLEIDFIVVSDGWGNMYQMLLVRGPMEKYCS